MNFNNPHFFEQLKSFLELRDICSYRKRMFEKRAPAFILNGQIIMQGLFTFK